AERLLLLRPPRMKLRKQRFLIQIQIADHWRPREHGENSRKCVFDVEMFPHARELPQSFALLGRDGDEAAGKDRQEVGRGELGRLADPFPWKRLRDHDGCLTSIEDER